MNIVVAEDLYPESLEGDEPEPLPQVRWPLAHLMDLLEDPDFNEARNVSALFPGTRVAEGAGAFVAPPLKTATEGCRFALTL